MKVRKKKFGLTILEVLVVIGVIGLLMALTIPAVLQSIEASRKTLCLNNLRQIGIALNSYHDVFDAFPAASGMPNYGIVGGNVSITQLKQYSVFTQLLSQLERTPLFDGLNFSNSLDDFYRFPATGSSLGIEQNATVFGTVISTLVCPADTGRGSPGWTGPTCYRVNLGTGHSMAVGASRCGPISAYRNSTYADILDGSSNTVVFSERPVGGLSRDSFSPFSDYVRGNFVTFAKTPDDALAQCAQLTVTGSNFEGSAGLTWAVGTFGQSCYSHAAPPNHIDFDCETSPSHPSLAVIAARSYHRHGVHVMYADGTSRFCANGINLSLWRAIATRGGHEVVTEY